ncbi:hypothetical protein NQ317_000448, partial [Molorchus minor]
LAALAVVAVADVSDILGGRIPPATSYGVPQSSVTENFLNAVPTSPSVGLNLPGFEQRDFNSGLLVSSTPTPIVSSTPVPSLESIVSSTPAPVAGGFGLGSGYSYTTPAPNFDFSGGLGLGGLSNFGSSFVSSTPAPNVVLTSGSQELLTPQVPSFNSGFNLFSTPAPNVFSTPAPIVSTTPTPIFNSGLNFGGGFNIPSNSFGLNAYPTPLPFLGTGGLTNIDANLFNRDAGLNSFNVGLTSGGLIGDAFGVATPGSGSLSNQPAEVRKHVYFYAAPEDPEPPRVRVNISPASPPTKNRLPPQNEEKTVVYVLVKKPEEQQDIEIQSPPPTPPAKPEVYFIRYKSQQEAEQAISEVQNGQGSSAPQVTADTVSGGDIITSIDRDNSNPVPIVNYFSTTTTPSPLNFIGGPIASGPILNTGFNLGPIDDISNNFISSGGQTSSLFTTGAPISVSTGETGLLDTSTLAPIIGPHPTYGPPIFKK